MINILKNTKGISVIENLFSILLVSFCGLIISGSIIAGFNILNDITLKSEANQILNLYSFEIDKILKNAEYISSSQLNTENAEIYFKTNYFGGIMACFENHDGKIMLRQVNIRNDEIVKSDLLFEIIPLRQVIIDRSSKKIFDFKINISSDENKIFNVLIEGKHEDISVERTLRILPGEVIINNE